MSYLFSRRYKQKCRTFCGLLFRNTHLLPIDKPLSLVIEFNGKGYDLTLVSLERLGISIVDYLLLCSGNASVLCKFKLNNIDLVFGCDNHVNSTCSKHSLHLYTEANGVEDGTHYKSITLLHIHACQLFVAVWHIGY